jgi:hypothetical protein
MQHSEALAAKIEARITELKSEIAAHERALAALRGRKTASASSAPASNGRRALPSGTAARRGRPGGPAAPARRRPRPCSTRSRTVRIRPRRSLVNSACRPPSCATVWHSSKRRVG